MINKPWPKSKAGCDRQLNALLNSYFKDYSTGGAYGFDWRTFKINSPERYERARALQDLYCELPFKDGTRLPR